MHVPNVVSACCVEVYRIDQYAKFAGLVGKVFAADEFHAVVSTRIGQDFDIGATAGRISMIFIAIGSNLRRM